MESLLTKEYNISPKTLAMMRGVWHAVVIFTIAAALGGPFSISMWYASGIKIYLFTLVFFILGLLLSTHLLKKDLVKEPVHITIFTSTSCFVLVGLFIILNSSYVGTLTQGLGSVAYVALIASSLAVFPLINFFWLKYYLKKQKNISQYQVNS